MSRIIKNKWKDFTARHPSIRQWLWFIALWCLGLGSAFLMAYPIKLLIRLASS